ncbi:recombinase family protein [Methylobacter sp.]|uniref:recombinase family protein n=1 Tax=Methylobacter sp. TaxID=2051955 RepID=UPI003DA1FA78
MLIGYARVSTDDQHLDNQRTALQAAGCQRLYEEKISGAKRERPELIRLLDYLRKSYAQIWCMENQAASCCRSPVCLMPLTNFTPVMTSANC